MVSPISNSQSRFVFNWWKDCFGRKNLQESIFGPWNQIDLIMGIRKAMGVKTNLFWQFWPKLYFFHLDYHQRRRWTPCIFMVENWTACAIRRFWKSNGRSKIHHLETSQEKWHCLEFWKIPNWQKWQSYQKIQQELSNCPYFQRHFKLGLIFDPSFLKAAMLICG